MAAHERSPLHLLRDDLKLLAADLREMIEARWELAKLELKEQGRLLGNLVCVCIVAVVMALTALPLLVWCLADRLDGWLQMSRNDWLFCIAMGLLGLSFLSVLLAAWQFHRRATGLQETLEELREDLVWFREWTIDREKRDGSEDKKV